MFVVVCRANRWSGKVARVQGLARKEMGAHHDLIDLTEVPKRSVKGGFDLVAQRGWVAGNREEWRYAMMRP